MTCRCRFRDDGGLVWDAFGIFHRMGGLSGNESTQGLE